MLDTALALTSTLAAWLHNHDFGTHKSLISDIVTGFLEHGKSGAYSAIREHRDSHDITYSEWSQLYDALDGILDV